jgi:hypothetical protein
MKPQIFPGISGAVLSAAAFVFALLVTAISASGATLYVAKSGTDGPSCGYHFNTACLTIQYTIDNRALAGDVIKIENGIYSELLTINKNLTLESSGRGEAIVDGAQRGTILTNTASATIERFIIRNGSQSVSVPQLVLAAGGILNEGTLTLLDSQVTGNSVTSYGGDQIPKAGGIVNAGTLTIKHSVVDSNTATGGCTTAGGVTNTGTLTTEDSLIALNTGSGSGCVGPGTVAVPGGILNVFGGVVLGTTTILKNSISNNGGFTLSQSTVSETAIQSYEHIVVINSTLYQSSIILELGEFKGTLDMSNSTVWNTTTPGIQGGVPLASTIRNSILAGNPGGDCQGDFISGDYNIVQHLTGCSFVSGTHDLTGVSPDLGALRFNGGPTQTMYLLRGSPAINGGNPAGCDDSDGNAITVDQRGFPRPYPKGGRCDIGAVEDQPDHWVF